MGTHSRSKGKRGEREVVRLARAAGLDARRSWELAQAPDLSLRACDVQIAADFYQVQILRNGFERIYRELAGVRAFFFRRDRGEWLVALRAADFLRLLAESKRRTPAKAP